MRREAIHFTLERVLKMRIQYAILRGKIYWLQLPVPTDLHERIGKKLAYRHRLAGQQCLAS